MPLIHTSTFKVRFCECDLYGHVNNTNYLRYMQEAAFEASAAVGYDNARYEAMGRTWRVHATDIEYIRPVKYGDTIEVKTWVMDVRRVTSRRAYELRSTATDELVAKATTDWAFLDLAIGKPVPIPTEMTRALYSTDVLAGAAPREKFPTAPPQPERIFKLRRRVAWGDCDSAQHVNNAVYAAYIEDCGVQGIAAFDWPISRMEEHGFGIFYRRMWIEYVQPAVLDDWIEITTWLSDFKRATAMRHFTITRVRDGALLSRTNILGVCASMKTGMPTRFPQELLRDFAPNIATV